MSGRRAWRVIGLAAAGMLLVMVVVGLSLRAQDSASAEPGSRAEGGADRFTLVAGPHGSDRTLAFLVDSETMRLLVYQVEARKSKLKLLAVRDISYDVQLAHWNNAKPLPEEIREALESGETVAPE